ncbi:hypothetical protein BH10PSE6_BH10PSE6_22350 [soil metagenome]
MTAAASIERKPPKVSTDRDTEAMVDLVLSNCTDGLSVEVIDVAHIAVWRHRNALGLSRA